jgi:hypothetical protein
MSSEELAAAVNKIYDFAETLDDAILFWKTAQRQAIANGTGFHDYLYS